MAHGNKSWYPTGSDNEAHVEPRVGIGNTASYQSSGVPIVGTLSGIAGLTVTTNFVTRAITVWTPNPADTISFDGGDTFITLSRRLVHRFEVKTTSIIATGTVHFCAELTGIKAGNCPDWDNTGNAFFTQL